MGVRHAACTAAYDVATHLQRFSMEPPYWSVRLLMLSLMNLDKGHNKTTVSELTSSFMLFM